MHKAHIYTYTYKMHIANKHTHICICNLEKLIQDENPSSEVPKVMSLLF